MLEPEAALEIVGGIADYFDEPFADSRSFQLIWLQNSRARM